MSDILSDRHPVFTMAVWADTTVFPQLGQYRRIRQGGGRHAGSVSRVAVYMKNSVAG